MSESSNNKICTEEDIFSKYITKQIIGKGTFSTVKLGINKETKEKFAIKLLEQIKKDKVESIKLLNSTHQSKLDYLNEKLNQLSESIREKENEDSKKYQQYIKMQEQYTYITKEKEIYIQQIKDFLILQHRPNQQTSRFTQFFKEMSEKEKEKEKIS